MRGDEKDGAGAQERGDHGRLQGAALRECDLREEARQPGTERDAAEREPGKAAAARFEENETG